MSEMVDRVARAMYGDVAFKDGRCVSYAKSKARAAIQAMRDPTKEMLNGASPHRDVPREVLAWWPCLIDAALK